MPVAALGPLIVIALGWIVWVVRDILQSDVQHLPRWGWILITVVSVPVGGLIYLLVGRNPQ